jgi:hypothetical protein
MRNNAHIIRLAALMHAVDDSNSAEFERELDQTDFDTKFFVPMASKLMSGKPYQIISDKPQRINDARSLAQHIGASVRSVQTDGRQTHIIFDPPMAQ